MYTFPSFIKKSTYTGNVGVGGNDKIRKREKLRNSSIWPEKGKNMALTMCNCSHSLYGMRHFDMLITSIYKFKKVA